MVVSFIDASNEFVSRELFGLGCAAGDSVGSSSSVGLRDVSRSGSLLGSDFGLLQTGKSVVELFGQMGNPLFGFLNHGVLRGSSSGSLSGGLGSLGRSALRSGEGGGQGVDLLLGLLGGLLGGLGGLLGLLVLGHLSLELVLGVLELLLEALDDDLLADEGGLGGGGGLRNK